MPVYDTDIEDVIEEEEGFVEKGGFGGEEDNIEDVLVVANDIYARIVTVEEVKIKSQKIHSLRVTVHLLMNNHINQGLFLLNLLSGIYGMRKRSIILLTIIKIFKRKKIVSFLGVVLGVEEESMPVHDTDIKDVIEDEEGFVRERGLDGEEDNIEDVVVVADDHCSSMIQTTLNVDFEEDINTKSHKLMLFGNIILIKVSKSSFKFLIGKKYQEWYLKVSPMIDEFGFKMIKVRGRDIIKKRNLMQRIQIWMLQVQGTGEANSRTSFFKWGRMMR
nr:hypothetical protein [Tanacetum cinerariifolium]